MSLSSDVIALIFFNCLGQLVLIFSEFTFCTAHDRLLSRDVHKLMKAGAAGVAAAAALGDDNILLHLLRCQVVEA